MYLYMYMHAIISAQAVTSHEADTYQNKIINIHRTLAITYLTTTQISLQHG